MRSGERTSARLRAVARQWTTRAIHPEQFVLLLRWADTVSRGRNPLELVRVTTDRRLKVDSTASADFPYRWVWPKGDMPAKVFAFTLPNEPAGEQDAETFEFAVLAPPVTKPEFVFLSVFSNGQDIGLPYVVIPRQKSGRAVR